MKDDGRCVVTVDCEDHRSAGDTMSWEMIYEAITEIEAKCVTTGRNGVVNRFGRFETAPRHLGTHRRC